MRARAWQLAAMVGVLTACSNVRPDVPGVFYEFALPEPPPPQVCYDLARELAAKLGLRIDNTGPPPAKGQCIAELGQGDGAHRVVANIVSVQAEHRINLQVTEYGVINMTTPSEDTRQFAARLAAAIHDKFPIANIREIHPKYGLFAP